MAGKNSYSFIRKWIFIGIFTFFALLLGLAVYLNYYWKPIVSERIKETIHSSTNGLYRIDFDDVRVNFLSGSVTIKNIHFAADTAIYERMKQEEIAPKHVYKLKIEELVLKRVQPWKIYLNKKLEMSSLEIEHPSLELIFTDLKKSGDSLIDKKTGYQHLAPYLNSVKITNIILKDADLTYIDKSSGIDKSLEINGLYVKVSDFLIDSAAQFDRSRLYYTKDIYAELFEHHTLTIDKNYAIQLKEFRASTAGAYARFSGLSIIPRFSEMDFSKRFKFQKERVAMNLEDMQLNNLDFELLNRERKLVASSLALKKANFSIFLNRELPDSLRNKGFNFPQLALQRLKLITKIDTLVLEDSRVDYSEYNPASKRKGTLTFSKINGQILNISNDSLKLARNKFTDLKLSSLLMDRGLLNVNMRLNLIDPMASFSYSGTLGNMSAPVLNSAIRPLSLIEINSGFIEKMTFAGQGNIKGVKGRLTCQYKDLKIRLLARSDESSRLKRKGVASIIANILLIKDDNPIPGAPLRSANFSFVRPPQSSFFNMIWKGLANALLETIGFDAPTQRLIKTRLKKLENVQRDSRKSDRIKKRIDRQNSGKLNPN